MFGAVMYVQSIGSLDSFSISTTGAMGCKKSFSNATHIQATEIIKLGVSGIFMLKNFYVSECTSSH
jgi:hypothetical protein